METPKIADPICCFFMTKGFCNPARPPCRYRHAEDDGKACAFGAKCRAGHAKRAPTPDWSQFNSDGGRVGLSPAVRDPNLLRSQLEPWSTGKLRQRLVYHFGATFPEVDFLHRRDVMRKLLEGYSKIGPRHLVRREGTLVRADLRASILAELKIWAKRLGETNHRPSIDAQSYTILRTPSEFGSATSRKAKSAAKKIRKNQALFDLAMTAIREIDPTFEVSALAVTKGFTGSPHIDKQNTGPFYGLALGSFADGEGGIRVEARWNTVVEVNSKNRLARVDGRYPHWVAPYSGDRFSLIYYQTTVKYTKPNTAVWPPLTDQEVLQCVEKCRSSKTETKSKKYCYYSKDN